jgi:hypothetical protein
MLNKFFSKPLELKIGDQTMRFHSVPDFEFSLNGRTTVPPKKMAELVKCSTEQLKKEAATIKEIEKRFVLMLSRSIEDPKSINQALRGLDTTIFSQDHGWRSIIAALNEGGDEYNSFRRVALVKYMQYLSARQETIKYLYSEKQKSAGTTDIEEHDISEDKLKETVILDSTVLVSAEKAGESEELERMPKGEVIPIKLLPGKEINIRLSKYKCKLFSKNGVIFIDHTGKSHPLTKGRNIIGRDPTSTIKLDTSLRDISRMHLVIENLGDNELRLTDLSSHGTYLPLFYLEQHSTN